MVTDELVKNKSTTRSDVWTPMITVKISNFGPIDKARVRVGKFTVFAGANNTGKSFATRLVYSLLNSMQSDLYTQRVRKLVTSMLNSDALTDIVDHARLKQSVNNESYEIFNSITDAIGHEIQKLLPVDSILDNSEDVGATLRKTRSDVIDILGKLRQFQSNRHVAEFINSADQFLDEIDYVQKQFTQNKFQDKFVKSQLGLNIEKELIGNFQLPTVAAFFRFNDLLPKIVFTNGNSHISFTAERVGKDPSIKLIDANITHYYPSNIFLESPIYWKLNVGTFQSRGRLDVYRTNQFGLREELSGVPDFFPSLREKLLSEYTGEVAFPEILDWINGESVLNGKIVMSAGGQLRYHDGQQEYPLQATATGFTNIGIIGLLIERKLINEHTFLFVDEPESNLHPAWQVLMAQLLFKLARAGVNVIFATHSVHILKYIEVYAQSDPSVVDMIQLNHFPRPHDDNRDFFDRLRAIQHELSDPYYRLYIGGI